ncbi:nucleosome assembly protein 1-like 4 [Stomoxys calcitrans]|uniref:Nucleosome assembly protein 1-like 1 n=1 Tax=Stomoxys calcitrans TaxID=35570 RepID=A0A1I8P2Q9_STOCA|nr:nucleosome assembly protein 1-like 4 [Stomoxys calcitrans]XP_013114096.1 nucleosome assembly protein 1-like 4 [Stomoxys calcitrans]XP_013114097.1 nucleosome assembly protein 1-like 4 [Stomoxys calcitrans]XP_059226039.1 nucleosome assembly protein 1-like 4 [Stomoxys calcitrans]
MDAKKGKDVAAKGKDDALMSDDDAQHDNEDGSSMSENEGEKECSTNQMVPAYMNAILRRQFLQEMVKNLPAKLQDRITVLKNIQLEHLKLEAQFFDEVYELEKKYQEKYKVLFEQRRTIVTGEVDPPKEDPKWKVEPEEESMESVPEFGKLLKKFKEIPEDTKGIPNFWLTIFRNTEILSEMVQEHDEPVLQKLTDITIKYDDEHSYTLEFHFDKNDYFTNEVLTKQYFLKSALDEDYPFGFEGPEIYKCKGCNINWEKKMNLTVRTIRKKQKHKQRAAVRTIVKLVPNDSFFNFFNPPEVSDDKEEIDEESQGILATDYEIGHFLRARIIPKAVLYYTGDVIDDEDEDDDSFDGEEEEDEESGDEKEHPRMGGGHKKKPMPNDCPNQ